MATKVHMEALSPTMEEGQLVKWLKSEGDDVAEGDILAEIETDKATMELVARGAGVLRKQLLAEGKSAPVGTVIGVIAAADEDIGELTASAPGQEQGQAQAEAGAGEGAGEKRADGDTAEASTAVAAEEGAEEATAADAQHEKAPPKREAGAETKAAPQRAEKQEPAEERAEPTGNGAGRTKASPLARRLAAESGVELRAVQGSGPGGRIIKRDIEAARAGEGAAPARGAARAPLPPRADGPEVEEIPHSQMRKTIAKRLASSIGPVPTFYLTLEVDMSRMMSARERINENLAESGVKVSVNDLLVKTVAMALARHPEVNASWGDDAIRRYRRVHIGVAVAVEDGLITPVVRDADQKGIADIAQEVRELAGRARSRKLKPDEYTGATFSISNLGMFGIDEFTAIINPPEAAILAVGRVEEKPVVVDGAVDVQPRMRMTMSCDHRVIDGATGAKFLQTLRELVEEPTMMVV